MGTLTGANIFFVQVWEPEPALGQSLEGPGRIQVCGLVGRFGCGGGEKQSFLETWW